MKDNPRDYLFIVRLLLLLLIFTSIIISCTKEVTQSTEFDFEAACGKCHSSSNPEYPLLGAREGYNNSGHYLGFELHTKNAYYANGGGCQHCHTNEGFIEYVSTGEIDPESFVANPSQPGCFTCHDSHTTGDFSIRATPDVILADGVEIDLGEANLCASCHRARRGGDAVTLMAADSVSPYWGPHHGPEADLFTGNSAYETPGKKYSNSAHTTVMKDACITCHMALPEGRYSASSELGGHSFSMTGEVHGAEKVNLSACIDCHGTLKQAAGSDYYDYKVKDYDTDGVLEPVQMEVYGLLELLVSNDGSGILQNLSLPLFKADGSFNTIRDNSTERPVEEIGALYNYKLILEDRSLGIHNTNYTIQILYDTIEALDPGFDTSLRP
ncbi:MAG: hypothetical protein JEY91_10090 [Spirochaetaceae bacterium]|nr:hypothetical protein [Spirochaetaceae bacterium]